MRIVLSCFYLIIFYLLIFIYNLTFAVYRKGDSREVKHLVYIKRQTRICTRWPTVPIICLYTVFFSTHELVVSPNFLSIRIVLSCFYLLIFYFEKFSTWIWRLPFAVYLKTVNSLLSHNWQPPFMSPKPKYSKTYYFEIV